MTVLCCSQTIIDLATADVCDHPVYYTLHHHDNSSSVVSAQREVSHRACWCSSKRFYSNMYFSIKAFCWNSINA